MPPFFPSLAAIHNAFAPTAGHMNAQKLAQTTAYEVDTTAYYSYSTVEDKAKQLSNEAVAEIQKASANAQAKVGGIELYSAKYYATCTLGGLMACVSTTQSL
jgi:solute carrier family 25 phosphate transporter 3